MSVHVPPSGGPEQDDLLRLGYFYNAPDDIVQDGGVQQLAAFRPLVSMAALFFDSAVRS